MPYFNKKRLLPALVLFASAFVIFWQFPFIPKNLSFDELEFTKLALSLQNRLTVFSAEATGHATPYFYLLLFSFKIFGVSAFGLRFPAAILGVLNSLLVYFLFRRFFKEQVAFIGALLFATHHWVFQFARYSFEATYLLFWELMTLNLISEYLKGRKIWQLVLAFVSTVFVFYSYLPGRIFFVIPVSILFINSKTRRQSLVFLISLLILAFPLLKASGSMENRVQELTYLNQHIPVSQKFSYLGQNISKDLLMFNLKGDLNGRHNYPGKPALNIFLGLLFVGGLILGVKNYRKYWVYWLWMGLSLAPTLFTVPSENPHFLRTYTITASVFFFITLALQELWPKKKIYLGLFLLLISASILYEARTYFYYQQKVFPKAFEKKAADLKRFAPLLK